MIFDVLLIGISSEISIIPPCPIKQRTDNTTLEIINGGSNLSKITDSIVTQEYTPIWLKQNNKKVTQHERFRLAEENGCPKVH